MLGRKKTIKQIEKQLLSLFGAKVINLQNDIKSFLNEGRLKGLFREIS